MNETVYYSTSTPLLKKQGYSFDYARKRDAYVDACYATKEINRAAKEAPDNMRLYLYRLKLRWLQRLYEQGYCVCAVQEEWYWDLVFLVDKIHFRFHLPIRAVTWVEAKPGPVVFEYIKGLPQRRFQDINEAIALLEWLLS